MKYIEGAKIKIICLEKTILTKTCAHPHIFQKNQKKLVERKKYYKFVTFCVRTQVQRNFRS